MGRVILASEGYTTKASLFKWYRVCQEKNSQEDARFDKLDLNGRAIFFNFKGYKWTLLVVAG
jgi:uncharacterized protein YegP (UPF0339 family)